MGEEDTFKNKILSTLQREIYALLLGKKGEKGEFFLHLLLLNHLFSPKDPYAKVTSFGVVGPEPLQVATPSNFYIL